jgi:hypothetical protein
MTDFGPYPDRPVSATKCRKLTVVQTCKKGGLHPIDLDIWPVVMFIKPTLILHRNAPKYLGGLKRGGFPIERNCVSPFYTPDS